MRLHNTGHRAGSEVVQAYLRFPAAVGEPPRQLKAFARVSLRPGRASTVRLDLPASSFQYFNAQRGAWTQAPGRFRLYVGTSSRDLPLSAALAVP